MPTAPTATAYGRAAVLVGAAVPLRRTHPSPSLSLFLSSFPPFPAAPVVSIAVPRDRGFVVTVTDRFLRFRRPVVDLVSVSRPVTWSSPPTCSAGRSDGRLGGPAIARRRPQPSIAEAIPERRAAVGSITSHRRSSGDACGGTEGGVGWSRGIRCWWRSAAGPDRPRAGTRGPASPALRHALVWWFYTSVSLGPWSPRHTDGLRYRRKS